MRRPKVLIPAIIVIAVLVIGVLAMQSRKSDQPLATTNKSTDNCAPEARADAAATKPGESVTINVLENDTDANGDPLVFEILRTNGGTAAIDDGGTPTDSGDDRLSFTPSDPPVDTATVEYQALDPEGRFSSSTVAVYVNPTATLPSGVHSQAVTDPVAGGTDSGGRCGASPPPTTAADSAQGPVGPDTSGSLSTTTSIEVIGGSTRGTTSGRRPATTKQTARATTTRGSTQTTNGGGGSPTPTNPPSQPPTTQRTTTTRPPGTTQPNACGDPNPDSPNYNPNFGECVRGRPTTTAPTTTRPPTTAAP